MTPTLVIGDYKKSSWSFRAWLVLKAAGVEFETVQIKLEGENTKADILNILGRQKCPPY